MKLWFWGFDKSDMEWPPSYLGPTASCRCAICAIFANTYFWIFRTRVKPIYLLLGLSFIFVFLCRLPDICYKEGDIWNQSQYLLLASWRVRSFLLIGIMTYTPERLDGKEMKVLNLGRLYHWQPFFLCAQNILKISRVSSGKPISSRIHSICRALPVQYFPKKLENILQIHFNLSHNSLRNLICRNRNFALWQFLLTILQRHHGPKTLGLQTLFSSLSKSTKIKI